jgi:hypothetical protein
MTRGNRAAEYLDGCHGVLVPFYRQQGTIASTFGSGTQKASRSKPSMEYQRNSMAIAMSGYHSTVDEKQKTVTCGAMEHNHLDGCHDV